MVNAPLNQRQFLWTLLPCAVVLCLAAWLRGAEYDEQYTLFLTSGVPRPDWPATVFPAGLVRDIQAGHAGLAAIAHDLLGRDAAPQTLAAIAKGLGDKPENPGPVIGLVLGSPEFQRR